MSYQNDNNVKLLLRSDSNLYCPRIFQIIQKTQTILIILHAIHWKQSEKQTPITLMRLRLQHKMFKTKNVPIYFCCYPITSHTTFR